MTVKTVSDMFRLDGKVAVVTGASSGLGVAFAQGLAEAGADLLLLECIPAGLGARITAESPVPVIGIGAGAGVDGQILVLQDLLGISPQVTLGRTPRFVKNYMPGAVARGEKGGLIEAAIADYVREVKSGAYPAPEHCFDLPASIKP